jgi:hypothetical protein
MGLRVVFVLVGVALYGLLREYFGLPRGIAALLAGVPWALAEAKGVIAGPYEEQSAKDVMLASDEPAKPEPPRRA